MTHSEWRSIPRMTHSIKMKSPKYFWASVLKKESLGNLLLRGVQWNLTRYIRRRRFQNSLICIGFEELSQCDKRLESLTVPLVVNPRTAVWNFKTQPFHLDQRNITVPFSFMSINFFAWMRIFLKNPKISNKCVCIHVNKCACITCIYSVGSTL